MYLILAFIVSTEEGKSKEKTSIYKRALEIRLHIKN